MGIKCSMSQKELDNLLMQIAEIIHNEIFNTLAYLGEQCTTKIRDRSASESWIDHTGNLRSSIGYAIFEHGKKKIESSFESVLSGSTGSAKGKAYVDSLASIYSQTYALVVVAGMEYADYVEAIDSKDVLASTQVWAMATIDGYLKKAQEKAINKVNRLLAA